MNIGLIARADSTGLGIQSREFFNHIPCRALVIDFQNMGQPGTTHILAPDLSAFPDQTVFKWGRRHNNRGDIPRQIIREFIRGLDILFCMETPYDYNVFDECRAQGVKTILQLNYEFLDFPNRHNLTPPDLFAAPSLWNFDLIPSPKVYLPVPARKNETRKAERTFLHIAGRHAAKDRNGTQTLLQALQYVRETMTVVIRGQQDGLFIPPNRRSNINLIVDTKNKANHLNNYTGGILVMPRKYGGLCLPMNEAISCGMPVIATDIAPNNTWLPVEWLVPAHHAGTIAAKRTIDYFEADAVALAQKMDGFCHPVAYNRAVGIAEDIRETISWETLRPKYFEVMENLIKK